MNPLNQATIEEIATIYDVKMSYWSELKDKSYDAKIAIKEESDNRMSILSKNGGYCFAFEHSDPDRVIAIAQMMLAAAQMVKSHNAQTIDRTVNK